MAPAPAPTSEPHEDFDWSGQLKAMQDALKQIDLTQLHGDVPTYGQDLVLNIDNVANTNASDSVWDLFSSDDEKLMESDIDDDISSDLANGVSNGTKFDSSWLYNASDHITRSKDGMDSQELRDQLSGLLKSDATGACPLSAALNTAN